MSNIFFYGASPEISKLELSSLSSGDKFNFCSHFAVSGEDVLPQSKWDLLGSVTHIAEVITTTKDPITDIKSIIGKSSVRNIAFTNHSSQNITKSDLFSLKKASSRNIRLISLNLDKPDLVPIKKQHALHLSLIEIDGELCIARTSWIHDFDNWTIRDIKKPFRAIKKGMLSPKLARSMINIATSGAKNIHIADPFCGTGTILLEGLMQGLQVTGSEIDKKSLEGAQENINWLIAKYGLKDTIYNLYNQDATKVSKVYQNVDYIITEPFMGALIEPDYFTSKNFSRTKIQNIIKGLEKLYKGCLKDWYNIIPDNGKILIIIPELRFHGETITPTTIDTCENLGYNIVARVKYSKPESHLIRNLVLLEKNGKNKTNR